MERSSTLRSPSAVRTFVPLSKQLRGPRNTRGATAPALPTLARAIGPRIAPIFTMLQLVRCSLEFKKLGLVMVGLSNRAQRPLS